MTEDPDDLSEREAGLMHAIEAQLHAFLQLSTMQANKDALVRDFARRIAAECGRRPR